MFNLLQMEFNYGIFDKDSLKQFVGYGTITTDQYKQITGIDYQEAPQSTAPASSAPAESSAPQSSSQSNAAI